jgi:hypothetical protein
MTGKEFQDRFSELVAQMNLLRDEAKLLRSRARTIVIMDMVHYQTFKSLEAEATRLDQYAKTMERALYRIYNRGYILKYTKPAIFEWLGKLLKQTT